MKTNKKMENHFGPHLFVRMTQFQIKSNTRTEEHTKTDFFFGDRKQN